METSFTYNPLIAKHPEDSGNMTHALKVGIKNFQQIYIKTSPEFIEEAKHFYGYTQVNSSTKIYKHTYLFIYLVETNRLLLSVVKKRKLRRTLNTKNFNQTIRNKLLSNCSNTNSRTTETVGETTTLLMGHRFLFVLFCSKYYIILSTLLMINETLFL